VVWNAHHRRERRWLVTSLVRNHKLDESVFDDVVREKGKGLVGLSSGSPGVRKTLTAEVRLLNGYPSHGSWGFGPDPSTGPKGKDPPRPWTRVV